MLRVHKLKCHPEPFYKVRIRLKTYEVRRADRDFQVGDQLLLQEWDPTTERYTGDELPAMIVHITPAGAWGLPADLCVLGIVV